jgi:phosphoglycerate dehydrogenase-like enzyme
MTTSSASPAATTRPAALLAMDAGLDAKMFTPQQRERLEQLVDLQLPTPVQDLAAVDDAVLARVEVLVTGWGAPSIDATQSARLPRLRAVVHTAGTVAGFVSDAIWQRPEVLVTTAAQANGVPVAEYTLAHILLAGKRSLARSADYHAGRGRHGSWTADDGVAGGRPIGNFGAVVGLIGASRIGRLVAQHLQRFDLEVLISDPYASAEEIAELGARKVELEEVFALSDVVSLHAPNVPSTRHMITADLFSRMADGTTFINTARPALVDEDAMRAELITGRISAVLDVHDSLGPDDPLWDVPTVEITPHIAGSQGNELHRMSAYALEELRRLADGEDPAYPVDRSRLSITA